MSVLVGASTGSSWAFPEQRQVAVVGNRTVFGFFDGTNTKFKWSTGGTPTDYGADLAGAAQLSFSSYQDAGGVWRIVAVWAQSGTVGGRTHQFAYVAVGTFSTDLNTLTWGAATAVYSLAITLTFPDVDVVPDGLGGIAMAAFSYADLSGLRVYALRVTISSSGAITVGTPTQIMTPRLTSDAACWPSVEIDPVSKHVGVTYSCRPTGVLNQGTFFRKGTYAAGDWTWGGLERTLTTDSSLHAVGGDVGIAACRWDRIRQAWVVGGPRIASTDFHGVTGFWTRDLADTTTVELFRDVDNPIIQESGSFGVDPSSGDILLYGAVSSVVDPVHPQHLRVRTLKYVSTEVVDDLGFVELDTSTDVDLTSVTVVQGAAHVLFLRGSGPYEFDYLRQALNQPPNAPTLISPVGGVTINVDQAQRLRWQFSDPDPLDTQGGFAVRYRVVGDPTWTALASDDIPRAYVDIAAGTFDDAVDYEWQVQTTDSLGLVGPYSASGFFTGVGTPGAPTLISPANGSTVGARVDVVWSTVVQDSFRVQVLAEDGTTVLYDSGEVLDPDARTWPVTFDLSGVDRFVQVEVYDAGIPGDWAQAEVGTSFAPPGLVELFLAWIDIDGNVTTSAATATAVRCTVLNHPGPPDPLAPPPESDLFRVDLGTDEDGDY